MRRVAGQVFEVLGGRDAGFVRGRLAHMLPPVAAVGRRWGGALMRRSDAHHGGVLPGLSRGFAAGYGGTPSGGGGAGRGRGGGGGGPRSRGGGRGRGGGGGGAAQLNSRISGAARVDDILKLVTGGVKLDFIHVAKAMNKLVRVAKRGSGERSWKLEGNRLTQDPRFAQLIDLVRAHCLSFRAREGANVLHALGVSRADLGAAAVDDELAAQLGKFVERKTRDMNEQEVANSLNALSNNGQRRRQTHQRSCAPRAFAGVFAMPER